MTPTTEAPTARAPAYSDWQGATGEGWAANAGHYEIMLADVGAALLDHTGFAPGERVVEIGCGSGRFAQRIAAAVAPGGTVLGLDISPALVQLARQEVAEARTGNLDIMVADAQTAVPPGAPFDRLVSRFGVMFFADPAVAPCHAGTGRAAGLRSLGWHRGQPLGRRNYGGGAHPPGPTAARSARAWPVCVQRRGLSSHPAHRGGLSSGPFHTMAG